MEFDIKILLVDVLINFWEFKDMDFLYCIFIIVLDFFNWLNGVVFGYIYCGIGF